MEEAIKAAIERHRKEMAKYSQQLSEFSAESRNQDCDHYTHRREMMQYHRGAINALLELRV